LLPFDGNICSSALHVHFITIFYTAKINVIDAYQVHYWAMAASWISECMCEENFISLSHQINFSAHIIFFIRQGACVKKISGKKKLEDSMEMLKYIFIY
jgi:hypothetical protein